MQKNVGHKFVAYNYVGQKCIGHKMYFILLYNFCAKHINTVELGYNVMKGTEYTVSL
jgi:hypothetical protein